MKTQTKKNTVRIYNGEKLINEMTVDAFLAAMPDDHQPGIADGTRDLADEVAWQNAEWRHGWVAGYYRADIYPTDAA